MLESFAKGYRFFCIAITIFLYVGAAVTGLHHNPVAIILFFTAVLSTHGIRIDGCVRRIEFLEAENMRLLSATRDVIDVCNILNETQTTQNRAIQQFLAEPVVQKFLTELELDQK